MINNFDKFKREFVEGEFYFIQLLPRKKDKPASCIQGINQNNKGRCIKSYSIYTQDQLDQKRDEMIGLCDLLGCRVYMHPARRSKRVVACEMLKQLAKEIAENNIQTIGSLFNTMCGRIQGTKKIRVVDYDSKEGVDDIVEAIKSFRGPDNVIIDVIETKNGYHILTKPFDSKQFDSLFKGSVQIQKNNPTLLYSP